MIIGGIYYYSHIKTISYENDEFDGSKITNYPMDWQYILSFQSVRSFWYKLQGTIWGFFPREWNYRIFGESGGGVLKKPKTSGVEILKQLKSLGVKKYTKKFSLNLCMYNM